MPGALNQLVGSHQLIPSTGTLNINLRELVFLSCVGMFNDYKRCVPILPWLVPATGALNINLRALVFLSRVGMFNDYKRYV